MKESTNKLQNQIVEFYDYLMNMWRNVEYWQIRFNGNFEEFISYIMEMYYDYFEM